MSQFKQKNKLAPCLSVSNKQSGLSDSVLQTSLLWAQIHLHCFGIIGTWARGYWSWCRYTLYNLTPVLEITLDCLTVDSINVGHTDVRLKNVTLTNVVFQVSKRTNVGRVQSRGKASRVLKSIFIIKKKICGIEYHCVKLDK